jgi:tetratricopeptide (TPR) repeat protein
MRWQISNLVSRVVPRSAPAVLVVLLLAAAAAFAAVSHLVTRFNANQQARARKLYAQGLAAQNAGDLNTAVDDFRAALTGDPSNSLYQLSLGRALRDSGDPRQLDEAESYLRDLWQRAPEDGTINLALARVAARRGSIEDALRYYHNAMYGVWSSDADTYRRKARLELIDFLLQKNARVAAQPELMALAAELPPNPELHLQAAKLFEQDQDYRDALSEYEQILRADRGNATAMAGAGEAAFRQGRYRTAEKYLRMAVDADSKDANARSLMDSASLILATDPFIRRISDAERDRRIKAAWITVGERLRACAQAKVERTQSSALPPSSTQTFPTASAPRSLTQPSAPPPEPDSLAALADEWEGMKTKVPRLRSSAETDLPDAIMDLVFQIEQQTAAECGEPQGTDLALLLISRNRDAVDQ